MVAIGVKDIDSVVAMIPHKPEIPDEPVVEQRFFVVEKPGLDVAHMGGYEEEYENEQ